MKGRGHPVKSRIHLYLAGLVCISVIFLALGFYIFLLTEIPSVMALKSPAYRPASPVYGINDEVVYLFVPDNKIFVPYNKIPKYVKEAFLAAEDAEFFSHGGVDIRGIARALWTNVVQGRFAQGGSTITQQVIKSLILGPEKSILRKVREAILAYRLERYLTKQEILNLYLNNIYMGHGVYGVEAASEVYFGKHTWDLSRAEAALLAGIVQAPARYTPRRHPGLARMRQEYVIDQLWKKGFINEKRKVALLNEKVRVRDDEGLFSDSYFKSTVQRYVEEKYGKGILNRRQLKIYTTVDGGLQRAAEQAVKTGLARYDERRGDYAVSYRLDKKKWEDFMKGEERDLTFFPLVPGKVCNLLITEKMKEGYAVVAGRQKGLLKTDGFPFKPGDVIKGVHKGIDKKKLHNFLPLKTSKIEGALVCMDVNTGYLHAIVGGRDFDKSPYNRSMLAQIQPGSAFKPFIYLAALEKGYEPDTVVLDEPKEYSAGLGRTWTPRNYDSRYMGPITVADAVAFSKNAATVRVLEDVGIPAVRRVLEQLGLNIDLENDFSIALGTSNLTLLDLVKGFSAFANGGYRVTPLLIRRIEDDQGNTLESNGPEKTRVIAPEIALKMNMLLKGVTSYGTAKEASRLGYPVAGKTGTTSNFYDALFVGYSPHVCTGVWTGFDARTSLGKSESGGRVSLPIWMNFMATALRRYPADDFSLPEETPNLEGGSPPTGPTPY